MEQYTIAVAGAGYVGLASALLLARLHRVLLVDIRPDKVDLINRGRCPFSDPLLERLLAARPGGLVATLDGESAYRQADFVLVAVPTDYRKSTKSLDTRAVEGVVRQAREAGCRGTVVIRSTLPVGYTRQLAGQYGTRILFCPEFLRESRAMEDCLCPSRIVVGAAADCRPLADAFARLLGQAVREGRRAAGIPEPLKPAETLLTGWEEAEAVKLFSNAFLAMRVAGFNELDSFAEARGLNAGEIIRGVCLDERIGMGYNNPSFGYGGYCLPKDTRQLLADFGPVAHPLLAAVEKSNRRRKKQIAKRALELADRTQKEGATLGVYRLAAKKGGGLRGSSLEGILRRLHKRGAQVLVYEPALDKQKVCGCPVVHDLTLFKARCDWILVNRWEEELADVADKVYTRDLFGRDG